MPGFFFDSSAIGKIYHLEAGTNRLLRLLEQTSDSLFISRLSVVEVASAFAAKVRTGQLSPQDFAMLHSRFRGDIRKRTFQVIAVRPGHFRGAENLVTTYGLSGRMRTLDALQLAIAMELADGGLVEQFVCSDKSLCRIASMAGLNVLDPEDPAT